MIVPQGARPTIIVCALTLFFLFCLADILIPTAEAYTMLEDCQPEPPSPYFLDPGVDFLDPGVEKYKESVDCYQDMKKVLGRSQILTGFLSVV